MKRIIPRFDQALRPPRIRRHLPVKQPTQLHFTGEFGLQLHRPGCIVCDKPSVSTSAVCRTGLLVMVFFCPWSGQVLIVEYPIFPANPGIPFTRFTASKERTTIHGNAQEELLGTDALGQDVVHGGLARDWGSATAVKLGLVACCARPRAGEIVGHDVEEV